MAKCKMDQNRDNVKEREGLQGQRDLIVNEFTYSHKEHIKQKKNQSETKAEGRRISQVKAAEAI